MRVLALLAVVVLVCAASTKPMRFNNHHDPGEAHAPGEDGPHRHQVDLEMACLDICDVYGQCTQEENEEVSRCISLQMRYNNQVTELLIQGYTPDVMCEMIGVC
ncbi:hypothetical protein KIPB_000159 [Kipferlia bialata]|uniref:Saposin B-type domain-containing protein n=1 Tax=Kipferlia bialata TaxID=797122 RepID=A0A9K3CNK4_9EUKA|nr:hypothetical protein KIPB_000159 [Kipferlia bialata]|eukprot:g159.t1